MTHSEKLTCGEKIHVRRNKGSCRDSADGELRSTNCSGLPHSRFLLCTVTGHVRRTPELTTVGTAKIANHSTHEPHVWPSTQGCRVLSPSNRRWHLDVRPERDSTTVGRVTSRIDASWDQSAAHKIYVPGSSSAALADRAPRS